MSFKSISTYWITNYGTWRFYTFESGLQLKYCNGSDSWYLEDAEDDDCPESLLYVPELLGTLLRSFHDT